MKLVLDNGKEVQLDHAGNSPEGEMLHVGFDTDHEDILSITLNLPREVADRIFAELGLGDAPPTDNGRFSDDFIGTVTKRSSDSK